MPTFEIDGKAYNNPVELALDRIGGKWKMPILWRLKDKTWRYGELRRSFERSNAPITHQMLSRQLRELEADGYVLRTVFPEAPPRVEYAITEKGRQALPLIDALRDYGLQLMADAGLKE